MDGIASVACWTFTEVVRKVEVVCESGARLTHLSYRLCSHLVTVASFPLNLFLDSKLRGKSQLESSVTFPTLVPCVPIVTLLRPIEPLFCRFDTRSGITVRAVN